jgi:hypothetical protein
MLKLVFVWLLYSNTTIVQAQETDDAMYAQMRFTLMQSADKAYQNNLFVKDIYIEKPISADYSFFVTASHDQYFESLALGVGKQLGNLQLAIGVGKARYDRESRLLVNGWIYYENNNDDEAILTAEHYSEEPDEPWYLTGYYQRRFDNLLMGVYGETSVGVGPMIGVIFGESTKLWLSKPIIYRPNQGPINALIGLSLSF